MYLKKNYRTGANGEPEIDNIVLAHTGIQPEQNFSVDLVTDFLKDGLMEIDGNLLTFHVKPESLQYLIKHAPGRYCLHCGEKLEADERGEMARLHVAMSHAGAASPDPDNQGGYVWIKYFECVLNAEQHAKYRYTGFASSKFPEVEGV